MAEEVGQIHGLISQEEARRMWKPYGERVIDELDGSLDPDKITPFEAVQVTWGADTRTQSAIYGQYYEKDTDKPWLDGLRDVVAEGPTTELAELLLESQNADKVLGRPDALTAEFLETGGSLFDIYSKGKGKAWLMVSDICNNFEYA